MAYIIMAPVHLCAADRQRAAAAARVQNDHPGAAGSMPV